MAMQVVGHFGREDLLIATHENFESEVQDQAKRSERTCADSVLGKAKEARGDDEPAKTEGDRGYIEEVKVEEEEVVASGENGESPTRACYTLEEVERHCVPGDYWTAIGDKVYNITTWVESGKHPGGDLIRQGTLGPSFFLFLFLSSLCIFFVVCVFLLFVFFPFGYLFFLFFFLLISLMYVILNDSEQVWVEMRQSSSRHRTRSMSARRSLPSTASAISSGQSRPSITNGTLFSIAR